MFSVRQCCLPRRENGCAREASVLDCHHHRRTGFRVCPVEAHPGALETISASRGDAPGGSQTRRPSTGSPSTRSSSVRNGRSSPARISSVPGSRTSPVRGPSIPAATPATRRSAIVKLRIRCHQTTRTTRRHAPQALRRDRAIRRAPKKARGDQRRPDDARACSCQAHAGDAAPFQSARQLLVSYLACRNHVRL